jgi:thioredoxin-dependent peroxiredoxin
MLAIGTRAPAFTLRDQHGKKRSLKEFLRRGPLILYFYPADFTPGCTKEACTLRDLHSDIQRSGLEVVGVSPQSPESHTRFGEKYNLPFTLLSDEDKAVIGKYDVDGFLGFGVRRATFLIGQSGTIQDAVLADIMISRHETFVRKAAALDKPRAGRRRNKTRT